MKVWIDISNSPQVLFFKSIIRRLEKEGHEVVVTARRFGTMEDMLSQADIPYALIGEHGGSSNEAKLICYSNRVIGLTEFILKECPDVALYKHSVEAPRVAYGLGIHSICVIDNENAIAQNKLMLPLSQRIIAPVAIDKNLITRFGVEERQIRHFNGFCELAHINDFIPSMDVLNQLNIKEGKPLAIMRPEPVMANYFNGDPSTSIVTKLLSSLKDFQCVVFPRTEQQRKLFEGRGAIIPTQCVDSLSLISFADIVMSAGGSMNREAVALTKPAISTYKEKLLSVTAYMVEEGIKMHSCDAQEITRYADKFSGNRAYEHKIKEKLKSMENPVDVIIEELDMMEL